MQYTFEDFKNTKVAVRISNQTQWEQFIDRCSKNGTLFGSSNDAARSWTFCWNMHDVVIICRANVMTWQYDIEPLPNDVAICVHANELLCPAVEETGRILNKFLPNGFPKPEPKPAPEDTSCRNVPHTKLGNMRYKIIIECDGDTTLARMMVNGHTVKRVAAKRNPADKFNWRIGAQTAFNRLWEKKKKPVKEMSKYQKIFNDEMAKFVKLEADRIFRKFDRLPPVVREVRRRAMPGEWVKVIEATNDSANDYKNGDVLQIVRYTGVCATGLAHYKNKGNKFLYDKEYVVLEGYKPE